MLDLAVATTLVGLGLMAPGLQARERNQRRKAWQTAFREAEELLKRPPPLEVKLHPGATELRTTSEAGALHLRVQTDRHDTLLARVSLPPERARDMPRTWIGWDVTAGIPSNWAHVPRIPLATEGLRGQFVAFGDDALTAQYLVDRSFFDLTDVRREARAHAASLAIRAEYLELTFHDCIVSPHAVDRMARAALRIGQRMIEPRK